jgi:hypothetical protein
MGYETEYFIPTPNGFDTEWYETMYTPSGASYTVVVEPTVHGG